MIPFGSVDQSPLHHFLHGGLRQFYFDLSIISFGTAFHSSKFYGKPESLDT